MNRLLSPALLVLGLAPVAAAQEADDLSTIDGLVHGLYDSISGPAGPRDWDRFASFFHTEVGRLLPASAEPGGVRVMSPADYRESAGAFFAQNAFYEEEVARTTVQFGQIAHVFSTYVALREPEGEPFARGINSMQLVNDGQRWWLLSITWDQEEEGLPIPTKFLPEQGRELGVSLFGPALPQHLLDAVAHEARPEQDRARDVHRKPAEVLAAFGIEPGMQVAELMASTGYYTEILSRAVGAEGKVYAQNNQFVLERFADGPLTARLEKPGLENVVRLDHELEDPHLPGDLDAVLMIRFYHDTYWQGTDRAKMNAAVLAALKPGGLFGVLDHHAEAGSGSRDNQSLHRIDSSLVLKELLDAGFVFEGESHVLRDPSDTRDWNIFANRAEKRDQTDRFVYLFRKPALGG